MRLQQIDIYVDSRKSILRSFLESEITRNPDLLTLIQNLGKLDKSGNFLVARSLDKYHLAYGNLADEIMKLRSYRAVVLRTSSVLIGTWLFVVTALLVALAGKIAMESLASISSVVTLSAVTFLALWWFALRVKTTNLSEGTEALAKAVQGFISSSEAAVEKPKMAAGANISSVEKRGV